MRVRRAADAGFGKDVRGSAPENCLAGGEVPQREPAAAGNNARRFAVKRWAARAPGNVSRRAGRPAGTEKTRSAGRDREAGGLHDEPGTGGGARQGADRDGLCSGGTRGSCGEGSAEQAAGGTEARGEDSADSAARQELDSRDSGADLSSRRFGAIARPAVRLQEDKGRANLRPCF